MKKNYVKKITAVLAVAALGCCVVAGCSKTAKESDSSLSEAIEQSVEAAANESTDVVEAEAPAKEEVTEVVEEAPVEVVENDYVTYEGELGYTIKYSPSKFSFESADGYDRYKCLYDDENNYISLSVNKEYSRADLVEGLVLQSGTDSAISGDSTFGSQQYDSSYVIYQTEDGYNMQFTLVDVADGVFVIETCMYNYADDAPAYAVSDLMGELMSYLDLN